MIRAAFDIGGTFTDFVLADDEAGSMHFAKVPTTPASLGDAVVTGLQQLLASTGQPAGSVAGVLHATTVATNAVLERKGARTALVTTRGFRDVLIMGRQKRYETYSIRMSKVKPLLQRRDIYEVGERIRHDGGVDTPLDLADAQAVCDQLLARDYAAVAVCFLHSYANDAHERAFGELLRRAMPHVSISLSCDVSLKFREYERTSTVVTNAYVKPVMSRYIAGLGESLRRIGIPAEMRIMQSNGGLITPEFACDKPVNVIESGPAAGVLHCVEVARREGLEDVFTFDMGGTTAKLGSVEDGKPSIVPTFEVDQFSYRKGSGLPLNIAAIELLEIGSGGGSIAAAEMGVLRVGPGSAGSVPGPICYGRGGTLPTVTDANVALGYIDPDSFNGGAMRLDREAAVRGIANHVGEPLGLDPYEAAWGIYRMANANMERALRIVSVERGRDPRLYAMIAFGGAGPLHAARLARAVGIPRIIVPFGAGVGSALGLLTADMKVDKSKTRVMGIEAGCEAQVQAIYEELQRKIVEDLKDPGLAARLEFTRFAYMRYKGQGYEIKVDVPAGEIRAGDAQRLIANFHEAYAQAYGYVDRKNPVEGIDWYLVATVRGSAAKVPGRQGGSEAAGSALQGERKAYFPELGGFAPCKVIDRHRMAPGERFTGPAVIEEPESTTLMLPGDTAWLSEHRNLIIETGAP